MGANVSYTDGDGGFLVSRNSTEGLLLGAWRAPPELQRSASFWIPRSDSSGPSGSPIRVPARSRRAGSTTTHSSRPTEPGHFGVGRTFGNVTAEYSPLSWLTFNETLGLDYCQRRAYSGLALVHVHHYRARRLGCGSGERGLHPHQPDRPQSHGHRELQGRARCGRGPSHSGRTSTPTGGRAGRRWATGLIAPQPFTLSNTANQLPPYDYRQTVHLESYFGQVTADLWDQLSSRLRSETTGPPALARANRTAGSPRGARPGRSIRARKERTAGSPSGSSVPPTDRAGPSPSPILLASVFNPTTLAEGGFGPASRPRSGALADW